MNFNEITLISSRQNGKAKQWLKLNSKKGAKKFDAIMIEGIRATVSALQNQARIEAFLFIDNEQGQRLFDRIAQPLLQENNPDLFLEFIKKCYRIEAELFVSIADAKQPQGLICVIQKPQLYGCAEWFAKNKDKRQIKIGLLDQISDPGNLGTIIRTANAFHYDALMLKKGSVDPYNAKVLRSTMGSLFALDLIEIADYRELKPYIKQAGLKLLLSDLDGTPLPEFCFTEKQNSFIICIGNEAHGISPELRELADEKITIPMPGNAESLNAAIAFAIIAYELEQLS